MTTIQIITMEATNQSIRTMIEEVYSNNFRIYLSHNTDKPKIFTPFMILENTSFSNAQDALKKVVTHFKNNHIVDVNNQVSSLLTTNEIKIITSCNNITES